MTSDGGTSLVWMTSGFEREMCGEGGFDLTGLEGDALPIPRGRGPVKADVHIDQNPGPILHPRYPFRNLWGKPFLPSRVFRGAWASISTCPCMLEL